MENSRQNGWISIHRKILEWEWYDDTNTFRLFIHCLLKANHQDKKYRGTLVPRGSFLTSFELLSKQTKLSLQSTRTSLKKLKNTQELTIKSTSKGTHVFITRYEFYQSEGRQLTSESTGHQQTSNKRLTTNNKDNNINNKQEEAKASNPNLEKFYKFIEFYNETYERSFYNNKVRDFSYNQLRERKDYRNFVKLLDLGYEGKDFAVALQNAYADDHHINSQFKYLTPEFILREDKFQRFVHN